MSVTTPGDCARSMAAEVLQSTGKLRLRVNGSSMLPTLWPGDLLFFEYLSSDLIQPSCIVLFEREGQFVVHRVVRREMGDEGSRLITRGDSMGEDDPPVSASQILGCLVSVQRGSRIVTGLANNSISRKVLGWLLGHSEVLHRLALRWHAELRQPSSVVRYVAH